MKGNIFIYKLIDIKNLGKKKIKIKYFNTSIHWIIRLIRVKILELNNLNRILNYLLLDYINGSIF
jgi:hypothetical protein